MLEISTHSQIQRLTQTKVQKSTLSWSFVADEMLSTTVELSVHRSTLMLRSIPIRLILITNFHLINTLLWTCKHCNLSCHHQPSPMKSTSASCLPQVFDVCDVYASVKIQPVKSCTLRPVISDGVAHHGGQSDFSWVQHLSEHEQKSYWNTCELLKSCGF